MLEDEDWAVRTCAAARIVAMVSDSISWLIIGGEERMSYVGFVRKDSRKSIEREASEVGSLP